MAANPDQMKIGEGAEAQDKATTAQMEDRLSYKFGGAEWSLLFQVRNAGGFEANRTCDAMAMGVWPSTGHNLLGFEIKVSRADWLKELKDPWKSEAFAKFCDRWFLVLPKADIVKPGELPDGWGVMVPHGQGLKVAHEAKTREKVEPLERGLLAAMLKRATTMESKAASGHYERGRQDGVKGAHRDYDYKVEEIARLKKEIADFEEASGVKIDHWRGAAKVGEAVKFIVDGGVERIHGDVKRIDAFAEDIRAKIAALSLPAS